MPHRFVCIEELPLLIIHYTSYVVRNAYAKTNFIPINPTRIPHKIFIFSISYKKRKKDVPFWN